MIKQVWQTQTGVTLLEILLLLAVAAVFLTVGIQYDTRKTERLRIDKTALQMQQILDAGLLYYVKNGEWPNYDGATCTPVALDNVAGSDLQQGATAEYLPLAPIPTLFFSACNESVAADAPRTKTRNAKADTVAICHVLVRIGFIIS